MRFCAWAFYTFERGFFGDMEDLNDYRIFIVFSHGVYVSTTRMGY